MNYETEGMVWQKGKPISDSQLTAARYFAHVVADVIFLIFRFDKINLKLFRLADNIVR